MFSLHTGDQFLFCVFNLQISIEIDEICRDNTKITAPETEYLKPHRLSYKKSYLSYNKL